ncbi:MAG: InlB B-repeat-containing protein [Bacteroidales bacterium]|nr:InlB B-repeat-containing protein [Bacteroidales bacterium]
MKKKFTFLIAALMLLTMINLPGKAVGQTRGTVVDEMTADDLTATSNTYVDFSNVSLTSDAVYAGQSAKDSSGNIQLRSKNSNSGIVTTTSGGTIASIKITVGSGSNTIDVYGSNTAYTSASNLYGSSTQGTKIGSLSATGTITVSDTYSYVGIRSNNGAVYISSIEFTWTTSGGTPTPTSNVAMATVANVDLTATYSDGSLAEGNNADIDQNTQVTLAYENVTEGYVFSSWVITKQEGGDNVTASVLNGSTLTVPAYDINISATLSQAQQYTITFNAGSGTCGTSPQTYYEGTVITEFPTATPSDACASNGWTFAGWATASANDLTSDPTISSYEVTGTATLYAVYKLVTAASFNNTEGGEFKIYANVSGTKYYAMGGVNSNKRLESTTDPSLATSYTFEKQSEGVYKINDGSNYVGSSGSADLNTNETSWTIESSNSEYGSWKVWANSGRALLFRTNTYYYFKNFSTASIGNEYFYIDFEGGSATYATSPSCTQTYIITLNQNTGGTIEADYASAEAGQTITLSTDLDDCYTFDSWTVTPSVTWTDDNTFTMPASAVTVSATFNQKKFTVNYSVNGTIESELVDADIDCGDNAELWTVEEMAIVGVELPSGCTFLGWSTSANSTTTVNSFTPTENATLYAVLHVNSSAIVYELVTSASQITEGTYLFAALRAETLPQTLEYSIATGSISTGSNSKDMLVTSDKFEPTNNVFTSIPDGGVEFELTGNNTDGFVISYNSKSLGFSSSQSRNLAFGDYSYRWKFYDLDNGLSEGAIYMHTYSNYTNYTVSENSTTTGAIRGYNGTTKYRGFYLFKKREGSAYTRIEEINSTETLSSIEPTYSITVKDGGVLTLTGANNGNASNLIIEDGGQLVTSYAVAATVEKNIIGYNSGAKGETCDWHFIASPLQGSKNIVDVPNLIASTADDYDLYRLNPNALKAWENYKNTTDHPDFTTLVNGQGYLYANKNGVNLEFVGNVQPSNENKTVNGLNSGFNLVGNPFTCNAYLNQSYYMLVDGNTISATPTGPGTSIAPCIGVIINGTSVTFSKTKQTDGSANNGDLELTLTQNVANSNTRGESVQTLDNAIVSFNENSQLEKFYFGNQNANIYIPQGNEEYAIVSAEAHGVMPVSFKANQNGQYTITVNTENVEMGYLHLVDNMTGADIDLLNTPSYTFNARIDDYTSRFKLVFSANGMNNENGNDDFAFLSNGQLIIANDGEATLQVVDITGRVLSSEVINGSCSKNIDAATGVYVLRLVNGSNVKTQKVIIK